MDFPALSSDGDAASRLLRDAPLFADFINLAGSSAVGTWRGEDIDRAMPWLQHFEETARSIPSHQHKVADEKLRSVAACRKVRWELSVVSMSCARFLFLSSFLSNVQYQWKLSQAFVAAVKLYPQCYAALPPSLLLSLRSSCPSLLSHTEARREGGGQEERGRREDEGGERMEVEEEGGGREGGEREQEREREREERAMAAFLLEGARRQAAGDMLLLTSHRLNLCQRARREGGREEGREGGREEGRKRATGEQKEEERKGETEEKGGREGRRDGGREGEYCTRPSSIRHRAMARLLWEALSPPSLPPSLPPSPSPSSAVLGELGCQLQKEHACNDLLETVAWAVLLWGEGGTRCAAGAGREEEGREREEGGREREMGGRERGRGERGGGRRGREGGRQGGREGERERERERLIELLLSPTNSRPLLSLHPWLLARLAGADERVRKEVQERGKEQLQDGVNKALFKGLDCTEMTGAAALVAHLLLASVQTRMGALGQLEALAAHLSPALSPYLRTAVQTALNDLCGGDTRRATTALAGSSFFSQGPS